MTREILATLDEEQLGSRSHAGRVAVYAVATAERLGYSLDRLNQVKIAAELHDYTGERGSLISLESLNDEERAIINLCETFDCHLTGFHGFTPMTEDASLNWLQGEAGEHYGPEMIKALAEVQVVVQPLGT